MFGERINTCAQFEMYLHKKIWQYPLNSMFQSPATAQLSNQQQCPKCLIVNLLKVCIKRVEQIHVNMQESKGRMLLKNNIRYTASNMKSKSLMY